jgi:uncharacterized protein (DUF2252 family)
MPKKKQNKEKQKIAYEDLVPIRERIAQGRKLRETTTRKEQGVWKVPSRRRNSIEILAESNHDRIPDLIPLRIGRMLKSPFTFFRGSASLMAHDLSTVPVSGIQTQICGDCHLLNFGGYASPERALVFDINDFDETVRGPWEWDLKRLATSFVLAGRERSFKSSVSKEIAKECAFAYSEAIQEFAQMRVLEVWYTKFDAAKFIEGIKDKEMRAFAVDQYKRLKTNTIADYYFPKMTMIENGKHVFKDNPPLVYHTLDHKDKEFISQLKESFDHYRSTLNEDRQTLLNRFKFRDLAMKIVGIGSVGTYCSIMLLMASDNDPLILQIKEARKSVLEPFVGDQGYHNQGHRVVRGQRLMQATSDIFLGWSKGPRGRHFYVRQLRDMKVSPIPEVWNSTRAFEVARIWGWILARAHARSGDAALISGYVGNGEAFADAIANFSVAYADQTERDYGALIQAVKTKRLEAIIER